MVISVLSYFSLSLSLSLSLCPVSMMFPLILLFSFLLVISVISKRKKAKALAIQTCPPPPPGPWKLPIIGSLHHLLGALPHRALRNLSNKYGPVMQLKLGEIDLVVVSSPEAAKEIMATNDTNFASRPEFVFGKVAGYGPIGIAIAPYGVYWRELRKLCVVELLSSRRVKSFSSIREEEVSRLVDYISSRPVNSTINLRERLLALSNEIVFRATCGRRCSRHRKEMMISAATEYIQLSSGFNVSEMYPSLTFLPSVTGFKSWVATSFQQMDGVLGEIISEHQLIRSADGKGGGGGEEEDLLDVLLRIKEHADHKMPLTMDTVKAVITEMFAAGTETTSSVIVWAMAELARNPEVMEKAQAEIRKVLKGKERVKVEDEIGNMHYLKMVIKETLRLHPPAPLLIPRVCADTSKVAGYSVAAGSRIIVNAWALGRDPRYWDDAESFKPERFYENDQLDFKATVKSFQYIPFGAGRRMCPGMAFGLASVELALAQLLFYFDWQLPGGMRPQDLDMTEIFGLSTNLKSGLLLLARRHIYH